MKFYGQNGEDKVLNDLIEKLKLDKDKDKWCVEFGAWDGVVSSNTYHFISEKNYKSVLIEADEKKYAELVKNMEPYDATCIQRFVTFDGDNSLDNIFKSTSLPKDFTFLSIDIDGNDYHVWDSLKEYRPKVVIIEFNPSISSEVEFVQPKDMSLNQGCSPFSLVKLGKLKGYELVATTLNNCFFVVKELFEQLNIEDNSLCKLRTDLSKVTYIFNGYDGHVFIRGYSKLDLYSLPYFEDKMQMIPSFLQGWNIQSRFKKRL
ncbi:MAG: hypothetical protein AB7D34_04130, partial [Sulfurimonas sp.]